MYVCIHVCTHVCMRMSLRARRRARALKTQTRFTRLPLPLCTNVLCPFRACGVEERVLGGLPRPAHVCSSSGSGLSCTARHPVSSRARCQEPVSCFLFVPACHPAARKRWPPCAGRIASQRAKQCRFPVQAAAAGWGAAQTIGMHLRGRRRCRPSRKRLTQQATVGGRSRGG